MLEIVGCPLGADTYLIYRVRAPHQEALENICAQFALREPLMVCADGYELQLIRQQVVGIPMTNGYLIRWHGDDARFVLSNIKLIKPIHRWWQFWRKS